MILFSRVLELLGCLFFTACLTSPLLDHEQASQGDATIQEIVVDSECPFHFPNKNLCASISWEKMPNEDEEGEFTIRFWKKGIGTKEGPYTYPGHAVAVKLWMGSMGHGSLPVKVVQKQNEHGKILEGTFSAKRVYFVMPGDWEIWIQLKDGKDILEQAKIDVEI